MRDRLTARRFAFLRAHRHILGQWRVWRTDLTLTVIAWMLLGVAALSLVGVLADLAAWSDWAGWGL
jgi:hypothetical protein